ncbi:hypothetical protein ZWY2020_024830 [Hordeum vulgare]|nr:hypothetical protein ZWY2020_024830 [Hordeum vulgare]
MDADHWPALANAAKTKTCSSFPPLHRKRSPHYVARSTRKLETRTALHPIHRPHPRPQTASSSLLPPLPPRGRHKNSHVGVCGTDTVVLGVEKKSTPKLQDSRYHRIPFPLSLPPPPHLAFRPADLISPSSSRKSMWKIASLDTHVVLVCMGLKEDARVLINPARVDCQSHRLTVEDPVTIAGLQQKYTQSGGVRPFGLSTLIVGFDRADKPACRQTLRHLLSAGEGHTEELQLHEGVPGEELQGHLRQGDHQAHHPSPSRGNVPPVICVV